MSRFSFSMAAPALAAGSIALIYVAINAAFHVALVSAAAATIYLLCLSTPARRDMGVRALLIVVLMPVVVWGLETYWLMQLIMLAWVPLFAGRGIGRIVPVYLLSLLLMPGLDNAVTLGGLKLFDWGVHDGLGFGAAVALFWSQGRNRPPLRLDIPACAIILMLAAALSRETSFPNFLRLALNVLIDLGFPYYIVSRGLRDVAEMRRSLLWLGCGGITIACILIYETARGWAIYPALYNQYHVMQLMLIKSRGGLLRAGGPFIESTSMAMVVVLCIIAVWACRREFRSVPHYLLVLAIIFVGLAAPQSRGAWMGMAFALFLGQLYLSRYLPLIKWSVLGATGVGLLLTAASWSHLLSETLGLSGGSSETSEYRGQLFRRGMEEFWDSPWVGFPVPTLHLRLADLRQGEGIIDFVNAYIWIMLIGGAIGLVIFVGGYLFYLGGMSRYRKLPASHLAEREVAAFVFAGISVMMEMLIFTSFGTRPAMYNFALFGFAAAFISVQGRMPAMLRRAPLVRPRPMLVSAQ
ncbi:O-antigen ligase family protein [Sphingobium bisphenolivorans]|uniref:O-antigen ligase family protein n=1 Tax=Sphingobium bisphenolivorans TaxID=1335760 RepID=UPI00039C443D|nr:O-antigen ligase family protein [Sphingobium bisphenolivorans]